MARGLAAGARCPRRDQPLDLGAPDRVQRRPAPACTAGVRSQSATGASASRPASPKHWATATTAPLARGASCASSVTSRVLPTPAPPRTSDEARAARPRPLPAVLRAAELARRGRRTGRGRPDGRGRGRGRPGRRAARRGAGHQRSQAARGGVRARRPARAPAPRRSGGRC